MINLIKKPTEKQLYLNTKNIIKLRNGKSYMIFGNGLFDGKSPYSYPSNLGFKNNYTNNLCSKLSKDLDIIEIYSVIEEFDAKYLCDTIINPHNSKYTYLIWEGR